MPDSTNQQEPGGHYRIEVENVAEMARLTKQGRLAIELLGLFPEPNPLPPGSRILDIGCGPGEWVLDVARLVPDSQVVGIDISQRMVDYARSCIQQQNLPNASLHLMDARRPLDFPAATFDIVHLSAAMSFLSPPLWPEVLRECFRVLVPGGMLYSIEAEGMGVITTPALARYNGLLMQSMRQVGQCFTPEGYDFGITAQQRRLLTQAGFGQIKGKVDALDYSAGTPAHPIWYENYRALMKLVQPFLLQSGLSTQTELTSLYEQALVEMNQEDFCAVVFIQTIWGQKA